MDWNPNPWKHPIISYEVRNSDHTALGGIILIRKQKFHDQFIEKFINEILLNHSYYTRMSKSRRSEKVSIITNALKTKSHCGIIFLDENFRGGDSRYAINFYQPPFDPWFHIESSIYDTIAIDLQSHHISLNHRNQVYWFIDFMKKVFLFIGSEFAWSDHFDYLLKHRNDDARQYIFGLTFYGKEMVEQIGREKLLTAPVYKVEEFENGSIMLQLHEHPFCKIPEKERRPILKHLGIKRPKKVKPPAWIKKKAPKRFKLQQEANIGLIIGVNAAEIKLKGIPGTLFDFYEENIHVKLRDNDEIPVAAGFMRWFDSLETGLNAYASGSDESGEEGGEYETFIGLPVHEPTGILTKKGDTFIPIHEINGSGIPSIFEEVREKLKKLFIENDPQLYSVVYLCQGEIP